MYYSRWSNGGVRISLLVKFRRSGNFRKKKYKLSKEKT